MRTFSSSGASLQPTTSGISLNSAALKERFPKDYAILAAKAGHGLRELLDDDDALDQAQHALAYGLLSGMNVTADQLKALGAQLLVDTIELLVKRCARRNTPPLA